MSIAHRLIQHVSKRLMCTNNTNVMEEIKPDLQLYSDFKKLLKQQKIVFKDGPTCLQLECRLCQRHDEQRRNMLTTLAYVNKRTGSFLCPSCDIKQNLRDVIPIYDKTHPTLKRRDDTYSPHLETSAHIVPQSICDQIGVKNLTTNCLKEIGVSYNEGAKSFSFPLKNASGKIVGEKLLYCENKIEETLPTQNTSGLVIFGPKNKTKAVIVTNLLDFLSLSIQRLENHCIVCLPYGLKTLPQECLPALERFKELIFWFNFDSSNWDTARAFATKMDEKRCLLIRPTDISPSPYEAYRKRLNLKHILQKATPVRHKSITTFSALRNDVLSDLQNIEKVHGVKWKRFPILNKLLKGHRKGELTIITGPTGSGKTTFMSEYSLDLALQGVSTLWGSFEIRNTRLAATLLRQFVGYSLENRLNEFDHWASVFEKYPMYFMTFHGQQPLKVVMEAIEHAHYIYDINHVIIDNLQFMMGISSQRTDKFWEQDAIIAAFRSLATKNNLHVTLVMHPRKERVEDDLTTSSVFGTAKATQEADNVLIIQDKRLTSLRGKRYLQIVKNRYSGDLGIMPLDFDKESLSYAAKKKKDKEKDKEEDVAVG